MGALCALAVLTGATVVAYVRSLGVRADRLEQRIFDFEDAHLARTWSTGGDADCDAASVLASRPEGKALRDALRCRVSWNAQRSAEGLSPRADKRWWEWGGSDPAPEHRAWRTVDVIAVERVLAAGTCGRADPTVLPNLLANLAHDALEISPAARAQLRARLLALLAQPQQIAGAFDACAAEQMRASLSELRLLSSSRAFGVLWRSLSAAPALAAHNRRLLDLSSALHACARTPTAACYRVAIDASRDVANGCPLADEIECSSIEFEAYKQAGVISALRAAVVLLDAVELHASTGMWKPPPSTQDPAFASVPDGDPITVVTDGDHATLQWNAPVRRQPHRRWVVTLASSALECTASSGHVRMHPALRGLVVRGALAPAQVVRVVRRHIAEVRFCIEACSPPAPAERVNVGFFIQSSGAVTASRVEPLGERSASELCLAAAVRRWAFPASDGVTVVRYPFVHEWL